MDAMWFGKGGFPWATIPFSRSLMGQQITRCRNPRLGGQETLFVAQGSKVVASTSGRWLKVLLSTSFWKLFFGKGNSLKKWQFLSPLPSGGWTSPPLEIISEMILGWSGTVTPWNHFSNIDFPPPEIILTVTNPPKKIISATVLGPQNHFWKMILQVM